MTLQIEPVLWYNKGKNQGVLTRLRMTEAEDGKTGGKSPH